MAAGEFENGGLLRYRVNRNSDRLDIIEKRLAEIDIDRATTREQLLSIRNDLREMSEDLKSFRRWFIGGTITLACGSLTFALTVLAGTGRI